MNRGWCLERLGEVVGGGGVGWCGGEVFDGWNVC